MASKGQVQIRTVFKMLKKCASDHTITTTEHFHCIRWNGRTYPSLPRGKHGKGLNAEIKLGHVDDMVKQLLIDRECAEKQIPALNKGKKKNKRK